MFTLLTLLACGSNLVSGLAPPKVMEDHKLPLLGAELPNPSKDDLGNFLDPELACPGEYCNFRRWVDSDNRIKMYQFAFRRADAGWESARTAAIEKWGVPLHEEELMLYERPNHFSSEFSRWYCEAYKDCEAAFLNGGKTHSMIWKSGNQIIWLKDDRNAFELPRFRIFYIDQELYGSPILSEKTEL